MALTAVRTGASSWHLEDNGVIVDRFFLAAADTADKSVADLQAIQDAVAAQVNTPPAIVDTTEIFSDSFGRPYTKQSLAKLISEGTALVATPPAYKDHFCFGSVETGEVGEMGWSFTNGSVSPLTPEAGRPGIIRRVSGATANQVASMYPQNSTSSALLLKSSLQEMSWSIRVPDAPGAATYRAGLTNNAGSNPASDGFYLEALPADVNWFGVRRRGSSETRTDTGIPVNTNWVDFRLRRVSTDNWEFYVNNGAFQVIHTIGNIPLETTALMPFAQVVPNSTTVRNLDIDFFSLVTK